MERPCLTFKKKSNETIRLMSMITDPKWGANKDCFAWNILIKYQIQEKKGQYHSEIVYL